MDGFGYPKEKLLKEFLGMVNRHCSGETLEGNDWLFAHQEVVACRL